MTEQAMQLHRMDPPAERPAAMTPMEMLDAAVSRGASIEVLEKLMALEERWSANKARRAFDEAIAAAKAEMPMIVKNREGHNKARYADFAALAKAADPVLSKHGLSYRFRTQQDDKTIRVTCVISHREGHSEENSLAGPADTSGAKNAIQSIGSTLTYLQRYSLTQALGLAASNDDDGRAASGNDLVSDEQVEAMRARIVEIGNIDLPAFLKHLKVERLEDLESRYFKDAMAALDIKAARAKQGARP